MDLLPAAWGSTWDDPVLAPLLAPLLALGGGLEGQAPPSMPADVSGDPDDPTVLDRLSRAVPDAVLHLAARPFPRA